MKIDILCNDGSPLGVTLQDLWGEGQRGIGIGGSEYALLTMCEQWSKEGHDVCLYNDPKGNTLGLNQKPIRAFQSTASRDVLIIFRSPVFSVENAKGLKVWWSCDQRTIGSFSTFSKLVDKIVCISPFHAQYFEETYNIQNTIVIDLPIRIQDFEALNKIEKIKNRFIYTSVPDRGLMNLSYIWPILKSSIPDASLVITSDYRLWGIASPNNHQHKIVWGAQTDVIFKGAIKRENYLRNLAQAEIHAYPAKAIDAELFCISCAEAQCLGVYPITSDQGALFTTNMGTIVKGDAEDTNFRMKFINEAIILTDNHHILEKRSESLRTKAIERFHPDTVSKNWRKLIFNDG